jgi:hypothetical protein
MRWFVGWLDGSGLDLEHVYAIHGTARVTPEQLDEERRLGASAASPHFSPTMKKRAALCGISGLPRNT